MTVMTFRALLFIFFAITARTGQAQQQPRAIPWSSVSYGPDGPWPAIQLGVGNPPTQIDVYPGARTAGLYDPSKSSTSFNVSKGPRENTFHGTQSIFGDADFIFDTVILGGEDGVKDIKIANATILAASRGARTLQNGRNYSVTLGNMALGAPDLNVVFGGAKGGIPPAASFSSGTTPSDSFGLHIGSPNLGIPGSLFFGGYDQARVIGPVSSQPYDTDTRGTFSIDLVDISIGVFTGFASPFNFNLKSGLLAVGNSSLLPSLTVGIEPMEPYLYLPDSTCRAIAAELPLTFNADLGLYLWDTSSSAYKKIVSTPAAYLGFTFRLSSSTTKSFDIKVPFKLLNLTLTSPLMDTPTSYFPCSLPTLDSLDGRPFRLGRAFLQAAFLGANWLSPAKVFFLAQAPGPSFSPPSVRSIQPGDVQIDNSQDDWSKTWKLDPANTTSSSDLPNASSTLFPRASSNIGLIVGVSVGIGAFLIILGAIGCLCWRRRRNNESRKLLAAQIPDIQANRKSYPQIYPQNIHEHYELNGHLRSPVQLASKEVSPWRTNPPPAELPGSSPWA